MSVIQTLRGIEVMNNTKSVIVIDNELIQSQASIIEMQGRLIALKNVTIERLQGELDAANARIENIMNIAREIKGEDDES